MLGLQLRSDRRHRRVGRQVRALIRIRRQVEQVCRHRRRLAAAAACRGGGGRRHGRARRRTPVAVVRRRPTWAAAPLALRNHHRRHRCGDYQCQDGLHHGHSLFSTTSVGILRYLFLPAGSLESRVSRGLQFFFPLFFFFFSCCCCLFGGKAASAVGACWWVVVAWWSLWISRWRLSPSQFEGCF